MSVVGCGGSEHFMATGLQSSASDEVWRYFVKRVSSTAPDVRGVRGPSTEGDGEGGLGSGERAGGESSRERLAMVIIAVVQW